MNIDVMEAGRELDALVAEKVMGLREPGLYESVKGKYCDVWYHPWMERTVNLCRSKVGESNDRYEWMYWDGEGVLLPNYSTEIADAWEVVDKLRLAIGPDKDNDSMWYCTKLGSNTHGAVGESAPLAICRAALKAVEGEK